MAKKDTPQASGDATGLVELAAAAAAAQEEAELAAAAAAAQEEAELAAAAAAAQEEAELAAAAAAAQEEAELAAAAAAAQEEAELAAAAAADDGERTVHEQVEIRMAFQMSGTREGLDWPAPGETITVRADEAAQLVAQGMAVEMGSDAEAALLASIELRAQKIAASIELRAQKIAASADAAVELEE